MTRPGYQFNFTSAPPNPGFSTNYGQAFLAATSSIGRSDKAVLCHNLADVVAAFGPRITSSLMYDAADAAFNSGVTDLWVGRRVGPAAASASVTLKDGSNANTLTVSSIGPGPSTLTVQVVAGGPANTVQLVIADTSVGHIVETSPALGSIADLVSWATYSSNYIKLLAVGTTLPAVVAATALTGGVTDNANVADTTLQADLLRLFPQQLGPGQIMCPGLTTVAAHVAMLNAAQATNRFALLDGLDSSDPSAQVTAVQSVQVSTSLATLAETYGMYLAPWRVVPGITKLTTRTVPPSAIAAGLIARQDAASSNPNEPAAGAQGIDAYSLQSSQPEWTDAQRQTLNNGGVTVFHLVADGSQRLYGYRTCAINDGSDDASANWLSAGAARLRMALVNELSVVAESFLFTQIDGRGQDIASFSGAIRGVLSKYWQLGGLYGDTADDAFSVDTGSTVNTPTTLANDELHANIGIKVSPFAEMIYFNIQKAALSSAAA